MPTTYLPPDSHIVRYVRKRLLRRDGNGNVIGILPQALEHRDGEEYLSTTWLEHFNTNYGLGFIGPVNAIRNQLGIKPNDGFSAGALEKIFRNLWEI